MCLDTGGEPAAAEQAARAAGWISDPNPAPQPELNLTRLMDPATAEAPFPTGLITGRLPSLEGVQSEVCSVNTPAPRNALVAGMSSWAGFDAQTTSEGAPLWIFVRTPDGPQQQPDLLNAGGAALLAAARARGALFQIVVVEGEAGSVLLQARIAP